MPDRHPTPGDIYERRRMGERLTGPCAAVVRVVGFESGLGGSEMAVVEAVEGKTCGPVVRVASLMDERQWGPREAAKGQRELPLGEVA